MFLVRPAPTLLPHRRTITLLQVHVKYYMTYCRTLPILPVVLFPGYEAGGGVEAPLPHLGAREA